MEKLGCKVSEYRRIEIKNSDGQEHGDAVKRRESYQLLKWRNLDTKYRSIEEFRLRIQMAKNMGIQLKEGRVISY
jgi:hypothetical protein